MLDVNQPFQIRDDDVQGVPVVVIAGELDVATAAPLRNRLQELLEEGQSTIVVDLLDVTFLDSTAIGVLVGALKACRAVGGDLLLAVTEPRIAKVLEITGLDEVFSIHPSVHGAATSLR